MAAHASAAPAARAVTPDDCLAFQKPTDGFLCSLDANTYGIDFLSFKIRDMDSKKVAFEVAKDANAEPPQFPEDFDYDMLRSISYEFPAEFLSYKTVGTLLQFKVGPKPVKNFRMIERHYFKNKLIKSFDFTFPFCMPGSTNEWEAIYDMPQLTEAQIRDIVESPNDFYFVEGKLIMHNKASYSYQP